LNFKIAHQDALIISGGRCLIATFTLLSITVATSNLKPAEYGIFSILTTLHMLFGYFLINPVGQHINKNTHNWIDDGTLISRLRHFKIYIFSVSIAGALITSTWYITQNATPIEIVVNSASVSVMIIFASWNATLIYILNMAGKRVKAILWSGATTICGLAFSYTLVRIYQSGTCWFVGQSIGMAIGALGALGAVRSLRENWTTLRQSLVTRISLTKYILPLSLSTGLIWTLTSGYRLLIEHNWGLAELGNITVGLVISAQFWHFFESIGMQLLYPYYFKSLAIESKNEASQAHSDILNTLGPIFLVLLSFSITSSAQIKHLFVSSAYTDILHFMIFGAVCEAIKAISNTISLGAQVRYNITSLIMPYAAGSITLFAGIHVSSAMAADAKHAVFFILPANLVILGVMSWKISRILKIELDGARWILGILIVSISVLFFEKLIPNTFFESIAYLAISVLIHFLFGATMLWNNKNLLRLTSQRLSH